MPRSDLVGGTKVCSNGLGHMRSLQKSSSQKPNGSINTQYSGERFRTIGPLNAYISTVTYTEHSYLELGYLGGSSETPKECAPGFMPGGGARVKIQDTFEICYIGVKGFSNAYISTITYCRAFIFRTWDTWEGLLRFQKNRPQGSCLGVGLGVKI